ncbi:MAG TPA: helix-turn-helix domain-containing protein [Nocardioidaceae bacterium]|nr:helix-turn-helix domain-containing protein [Nocardioidaceae bacterium]
MRTWSERLAAVSALAEPVRRSLFDLVARSTTPVTRDTAAEELGLARSTAAFHLERLAEEGLVDVEFQRLTGRTGPGSGRPAKVYRQVDHEVGVSVPDRRYDLAGELLATAVEESAATDVPVREVLMRLAREEGRALGAATGSLSGVLAECGFEPRVDSDGGVQLTNCPFHRLAQRHPGTVCGLNVELLRGAAEAADEPADPRDVVLDPAPGRCCVRILAAARP